MNLPTVREIFAPIFGLPCWGVGQGHGTFLTMEFGHPRQEIIHPVYDPRPGSGAQGYARRTVVIRGDWHLWIYCCGWRIAHGEHVFALWDSSAEMIATACRRLDGQVLTGVEVETASGRGRSLFIFDLGGCLETWPYDDELNEQWLLYCPDGNVYTYRSDGFASYQPGSGPKSDEQWTPAL
jgi:hypothetical protein